MIGKPYSGKLNVRFDEGELEIGHLPLRQFSTLPLRPFTPLRYIVYLRTGTISKHVFYNIFVDGSFRHNISPSLFVGEISANG